MLSPQKISSVTSVERASSVSILSPAVSVTASVEPTENEWPSVSVRVTVYPCESVTGAIITGISRASPVQSMGEGGVTVIVCADAGVPARPEARFQSIWFTEAACTFTNTRPTPGVGFGALS